MLGYASNIAGGEWMIIIFVALVLILGTNKLPEAAKKLGRAVNEFNKAKDGIQDQMKDYTGQNIKVGGPVQTEREKLEIMASSMGEDPAGKSTAELRDMIAEKIGKKSDSE